jgi:hypothetical protein
MPDRQENKPGECAGPTRSLECSMTTIRLTARLAMGLGTLLVAGGLGHLVAIGLGEAHGTLSGRRSLAYLMVVGALQLSAGVNEVLLGRRIQRRDRVSGGDVARVVAGVALAWACLAAMPPTSFLVRLACSWHLPTQLGLWLAALACREARDRDRTGVAALVVALGASLPLVPDWQPAHLAHPTYLATFSYIAVTVALLGMRAGGHHWPRLERALLAAFLAGMPLVYVWSWLLAPAPGWLGFELAGALLFIALAVLGVAVSPWFTATGILAHGTVWDLWHYGRQGFVPGWYNLACLIADCGVALYVGLRALDRFGPAPVPASTEARPR